MRRLASFLVVAILPVAMFVGSTRPAKAQGVDAFAIADAAGAAYQKRESYADVRAVLSEGIRTAGRAGPLPPDFGIVYAMYSDTSRFEGNPAFALQIAEEGLDLVVRAGEPDLGIKNALLVSRAYALADLGRYEEAVDAARITALWMAQTFGEESGRAFEADAAEWAALARDGGRLPSAGEVAVKLLEEANAALDALDTGRALSLASRALVPGNAAMAAADIAGINARSHTISGVAYSLEGRARPAFEALLRAADLLSAEPWDRVGRARLRPEVERFDDWREMAFQAFGNLAAVAAALRDTALASAAIDTAQDYADLPDRRFALMVQRAGVAFQTNDFAAAEATFRQSEEAAIEAGDGMNAALARLYREIARLQRLPADDARDVSDLLALARAAATVAEGNLQMREYVLTTAVRLALAWQGEGSQILPVAEEGFAAFKQRQASMSGYDSGQEAVRRERRRFIESYMASLYETDRPEN